MRTLATTLTLLLIASQAQAVNFSGTLNPGDTFHLVFVTRDSLHALNSNINFYNGLVQNQAAINSLDNIFGQAVTWRAFASTPGVNANVNIGPIVAPIFNTAGDLIATNSTDFYDGSLANPIRYDQFMNEPSNVRVWTGSSFSGVAVVGQELSSSFPVFGSRLGLTTDWTFSSSEGEIAGNLFYAISSPIIFMPTSSVPEPITAALIPLALVPMLLRRRREV